MHSRILPREAEGGGAPAHAISQPPNKEMAGQWGEGICAKHSHVNKERGFLNCRSAHHMSFVSFLVLIKIFMAKAASC